MSNYQLDYQKPLIQESSSTYFYPLQPHTYDYNKEKHQYPNGIKPIVYKPVTHPIGNQEKYKSDCITPIEYKTATYPIGVQEKYKNDYNYSLTFFILGSPICKVRKTAFISLLLATAYIILPYILGLVYVFANLKKL
ncbi:hypothetical protein ACTFIY_012490 [Dictyostelium cf. discoideum]